METILDILAKEARRDKNILSYIKSKNLENEYSKYAPIERLDKMCKLFNKCETWRVRFREQYWFDFNISAQVSIRLSFNELCINDDIIVNLEDVGNNFLDKLEMSVFDKFVMDDFYFFMVEHQDFPQEVISTIKYLRESKHHNWILKKYNKDCPKLAHDFYVRVISPDCSSWIYSKFPVVDALDFKYLIIYALGTRKFKLEFTPDDELRILDEYNKSIPITDIISGIINGRLSEND